MKSMDQAQHLIVAEKHDASGTHPNVDEEWRPGAPDWTDTNCPGCKFGLLFHEHEGDDWTDGWELARCSRCDARWQRYGDCPTCRHWTQIS